MKMDEVRGEWRKLHNEEHNAEHNEEHNEEHSDPNSSPSIFRVIKSRRMKWTGHVARMGERRGVYRDLVGKPKGKRLHGKPRRRWEDNIGMGLQEVGCEDIDWIELAQDTNSWRALVNAR
jgi:hypothetical protein